MNINLISVVMLLVSAITVFPQTFTDYELEIEIINNRIRVLSEELDSLKTSYNEIINEIDAEKNKANSDEDRIADLMSNTISLTKQIDVKQIEINITETKLREKKKELDIIYTHIIDSLKMLETGNTFKGNRNKLSLDILVFMEKKLNNGTDMEELKYNPSGLLDYEISESNHSDKDLYTGYLKNAVSEVDAKMKAIASLIQEIDQTNKLRRKVDKFIDDSEFSTDLIRNQNNEELSNSRSYEGNVFGTNTLESNYKSYSYLLSQLSIQQFLLSGSREGNNDYIISEKEISVELFVKLLEEVNSRLKKYNAMLLDKLSEIENADN